MNTRSLRFQLIIWYAGLLTGVFVLFGFSMYFSLKHYLEGTLSDERFRRDEQIARTLLVDIDKTGEQHVRDEIEARYAPARYDLFIRITRGDGTVLYNSGRPKDHSFDPTSLAIVRGPTKDVFVRMETLADGKKLLISAVTWTNGIGKTFLVEAGAPYEPLEAVLARLLSLLALGLPLLVAVAVGGGCVLVRRALAPVVRIAQSAEQITLLNLDDRLPLSKTGDELEGLSIALNRMIGRINEAFEQNKRFLADASHELRTPLTVLRGELETVVQQTGLNSEARETVGSALEEVERLAKIVQGLFAISRLDAGEAQAERVRFDLAKLAATTADQMCLLAEDKGISVSCNNGEAVIVEGDQSRMKQVVVNLLDNAIKFTPHGGSILVTVGVRRGKAVLEVADNGIGIPAEALLNVFERFFRVDKTRSRELGGAGLGLSIVRSICAAHNGGVEVESTPGKGSRFCVELPLANGEDKRE